MATSLSLKNITKPLLAALLFVLPNRAWKITVYMWFGYLCVIAGIFWYVDALIENKNDWFGEMPSLETLENPSTELASEIYTADSVLLGKYFRSNRTPIRYSEISDNMKDALLATEDIRFHEHSGIDMKGTFAIMYYMALGKQRGSSTVTQQLAKILFNSRGKQFEGNLGLSGKFLKVIQKSKEWVIASRIEKSYSKEEIMAMYLNAVDFGSNSFGLKVASSTFFGKDQAHLKVEEAAMLAGLLKAPSAYSPIAHPDSANFRRNTILDQMAKYQYISQAESDSLQKDSIKLNYKVENHNDGNAPYFRKVVGNHLKRWCKARGLDLYADGLKIYTTLDSKMQQYAEESVNEHMVFLQGKFFDHWEDRNPWSTETRWGGYKEQEGYIEREIKKTYNYRVLKKKYDGNKDSIDHYLNVKRPTHVFSYDGGIDTVMSLIDSLKYYKHFLHAGFMSMDPTSGEIKAWVGGIDHKYFKYDHVKQGIRQPGSTFKPIVYASILGEIGTIYSPCYKVVDAPVTFLTGNPDKPTWTPQNAEGKYSGDTLTLRQAMARSVNSVTAYMMKIMGDRTPHTVKEYAERLGITSKLEPVPAMCLGTFDVSVYDLVGAYCTFANKGVYTKPHFITKIVDRNGNLIVNFPKERRQELTEEMAYVMLHMLMGATQEKGGTALGLRRYGLLKDNQVGAKTGTTQNHSDGWFMGVTKGLVNGGWVGGDDRSIHFRTLEMGQGARMAMPIWALYMQKVYADSSLGITRGEFEEPEIDWTINLDCDNESTTDSLDTGKPKLLDDILYDDDGGDI